MKKILIIFSVFLFIFAFAASVSAAAPDDLVGWWRFENNADDSTINNLDGVAYGVSYAEGIVGQAASFTGTSYVVVEDNNLLEVDDITLEAWVKAEASPGNYRYIAGKRYSGGAGSYALYTGGNGGLRFYINRSGGYTLSPTVAPAVIWDGEWHHVAGTYDGSIVRFYVDGVEVVAGTSATGDIVYNDQDFYIGSYGLGYYFNGLIDEVRIWNKALTPAELGDNESPVVDITAPSDGVYYTTISLPAAAYTISDANDYIVAENGYSTDEGNHTYTVTATDIFGYEGSDSISYTVDNTAPVLTADFTANGFDMPKSVAGEYILVTNGVSTDNHELQFTDASNSDELLKDEPFSLYLDPTNVNVGALETYYDSRTMPDVYRNYLKSALDGFTKPFAYITGETDNGLFLHDAAQYDILENLSIGMIIPDDYPVGVYPVQGIVKDLAENPKDVSYTLVVIKDLADLTPETAYNPVGTEHTYTTNIGVPVEGVNILFTVIGANPQTAPVPTDATGEAEFTYDGINPGKDEISACIDADEDGECEGVSTNTVTKYWLEKFVTGGGNVKNIDLVSTQVGKKLVMKEVLSEWFSFGGNVGIAEDETQIVGNFQVNNHLTGETCHFKNFDSLVFSSTGTGELNTVTFIANGVCKSGEVLTPTGPVTFIISDESEPGVDDMISISEMLEESTLTGGNFQVRPPAEGASVGYPIVPLTGDWSLSINGGAYMHDLIIVTQNPDGTLSGTGGYPVSSEPPYNYPYNWKMTGMLIGNTITMTITYENGYTATISGIVDTTTWDSMGGGAGTGGVTSWLATRL